LGLVRRDAQSVSVARGGGGMHDGSQSSGHQE
jgi:hypothetical protein